MAFRGRYMGRAKAWPAVVNPAVHSPLQNVLSLRGEWEFVTRGVAPSRHPGWVAFYAKPWPEARKLQVPGCWEAGDRRARNGRLVGLQVGPLRQAASRGLSGRRLVS